MVMFTEMQKRLYYQTAHDRETSFRKHHGNVFTLPPNSCCSLISGSLHSVAPPFHTQWGRISPGGAFTALCPSSTVDVMLHCLYMAIDLLP